MDLREVIVKLGDKKKEIEEEIELIIIALKESGIKPGQSLIDSEGFPIGNCKIDLYDVRHKRARLVELRNDLKQVVSDIQHALHTVHAAAAAAAAAAAEKQSPVTTSTTSTPDMKPTPTSTTAASARSGSSAGASSAPSVALVKKGENGEDIAVDEDKPIYRPNLPWTASLKPFARVLDVNPNGPMHQCGFENGDRLLKLGAELTAETFTLPKMAQYVQSNEGKGIECVVLRNGMPIILSLVPKKWDGRGLLGAFIQDATAES